MKLNIVKAVSIAGLLLISQLAQASPVVDTFVVGEPLTAAQMNTIKAIVDYNRSDIESSITAIRSLESEPKATVSSIPPAPSDDINLQYIVGSVWVDSTSGEAYILTDSTSGAAVWKLTTHSPTVYALGDPGPAGGIVFYITDDGLHGLEAAPSDSSASAAWGCNDTILDGMNETGVGSGAHNTSQRDLCADAPTAAKTAAAYVFNGYTDWFLPSKNELNLMWENLADPADDGRSDGFDGDTLGGFAASSAYWSSSQVINNSENQVYTYHFLAGSLNGAYKVDRNRVRAVRAF
jgi:hypothetical protein